MHHHAYSSLTQLLLHFFLTGVSVFIVAHVLPGIRARSFGSAFWFAVVLSFLSALTWHVFGLVTVPFAVVTLGVGALVINGIVFLIAGRIVSGIEISGCFVAAIASLCVTFVNSIIQHLVP
jgi:putative membrane protein